MTIKDYTPRPTQKKLIAGIVDRLKNHDDTALVAGTGIGKTICSAHLIAYYSQVFNPKVDGTLNAKAWVHNLGFNQIVFIVHLDSLVQQTYKKFQEVFKSREVHLGKKRERNMSHGITFIKNGMEFDPTKPIVIASLQTLKSRYEHYIKNGYLKPAMLIFDECHTTSFCDTGRKLINDINYKKRIGLTATPFRLENVSFSDLWTNCIVSPSFGEMVKRGELCKLIYQQFVSADETSDIKLTNGDFNQKASAKKFNTPEKIKFAIDKWGERAKERKTIVFTIDVKHGESVKEEFTKRGYSAEIISYKTKVKDRKPIFKKFADGELDALISVRALSVGFDEPSCTCGIDLQPTTSISNHWQKIGRIARVHPGKKDGLWLDFTGNIERLLEYGCPDNVVMTERSILEKKEINKKKGLAPFKICEKCQTVNHASAKKCVNKKCYHEFPKKSVLDLKPTGDLVQIITKSMVEDDYTAKAFYRSLRHKRWIKGEHPNSAYHEYIQTEPVCDDFPIPHPRDRNDHKQWSQGCITGEPDNYDVGIEFLDKITKIVRKNYREMRTVRALIDSALWLEFNEDVYDQLKIKIDSTIRDKQTKKEFIENLFA